MTERFINVIYINFCHRGKQDKLIETEIQLEDLSILPKLFKGVLRYNKNRRFCLILVSYLINLSHKTYYFKIHYYLQFM